MSSRLVALHSVSLSRGIHICFHDAQLVVHDRCRMAVIGPNGSGKSSLLSLIAGDVSAESGSVDRQQSLKFARLFQCPMWPAGMTVRQVLWRPFQAISDALAQVDHLSEHIGQEASIDAAYSRWIEFLNEADGYSVEMRIDQMMSQMDLMELSERSVGCLSGGEQMRLALAELMLQEPSLLLLDEPTNHLDARTRGWLLEFLETLECGVVIATHDADLLSTWPTELCVIADGCLSYHHCGYLDFLRERDNQRAQEAKEYADLLDERSAIGHSIQQRETRRVRTRKQGQKKYAHDKLLRKGSQERAENTMGRGNQRRLLDRRDEVVQQIRDRRKPRAATPRFHFSHCRHGVPLTVRHGNIGFDGGWLQTDLNLSLQPGQRLAITGDNGSGKSCLLACLQGDGTACRSGEWDVPISEDGMGYLDQHYALVDLEASCHAQVKALRPDWTQEQVRSHLDAFQLNDHRLQDRKASTLSLGQRARLCFALLAARAPSLLLLDEVTNNLDIDAKEHLVEVLKAYPGTLVLVSHEQAFLEQVGIDQWLHLDSISAASSHRRPRGRDSVQHRRLE